MKYILLLVLILSLLTACDDSVNIRYIEEVIAGTRHYTDKADINKDGKIDALDITSYERLHND